jgi:hypothetical protein
MRAAVSASMRTGSRMLATSSTTCAGSSARMLRYSLLTRATLAAAGEGMRFGRARFTRTERCGPIALLLDFPAMAVDSPCG